MCIIRVLQDSCKLCAGIRYSTPVTGTVQLADAGPDCMNLLPASPIFDRPCSLETASTGMDISKYARVFLLTNIDDRSVRSAVGCVQE
jgi:hypothetical protein